MASSPIDQILRSCSDRTLRGIKMSPPHDPRLYRACTLEYVRRIHNVLRETNSLPWIGGVQRLQALFNGAGDAVPQQACPTIEARRPRRSTRADAVWTDASVPKVVRVHAAYRLRPEEVRRLRLAASRTVLALIY